MEYRETFSAGGGKLTKDAHDRAMRQGKGPLIGGGHHPQPPKQRPAGSPIPNSR